MNYTNEPRIVGFHWSHYMNNPLILYIQVRYSHGAVTPTGLRDHHLVPVLIWCEENNINLTRLSWNIWQFEKESDITMLMLKWG